ncbi:hypothetical protein [Hahella sp. CCB-MM4]|uniref:hypothetical protein n=1 Tax=Hahella sp. (strain CCB-MM4) TaxID=1926491 RepID=UPI0011401308|nr:hypothetical protein [Hahella sp. CCB-MM4]
MPHHSVPHHSIELLKLQLSFQLRSYLRHHSATTAQQIVLLIESILRHPDNQDPYQDVCSYHKLLMQWRAINLCYTGT